MARPGAGGERRAGPRAHRPVLRAGDLDALLVDLDGVLTRTAAVHAAAWKAAFDDFLAERAKGAGVAGPEGAKGTDAGVSENAKGAGRIKRARRAGLTENAPITDVDTGAGTAFRPFDIDADYRRFVDGKPRYDGVAAFLASRAIRLPFGSPDDPPEAATVCGLGNRKNAVYLCLLKEQGVAVYPASIAFLRAAKARGLKLAVVSSSRNCAAVLAAAGLTDIFDARVDGIEVARLGLKGKPAPDMFLEAARRLAVAPARAAVIEDAISGVAAGHAGGFAHVIGVDRTGHGAALAKAGADIVVGDLGELAFEDAPDSAASESAAPPVPESAVSDTLPNPAGDAGAPGRPLCEVPSALARGAEIGRRLAGKRLAVFLDYDGTLTPIVARPELAVMDGEMRGAVRDLAALCPVAIISGRARTDVAKLVGLPDLTYAGSHGFNIAVAGGRPIHHAEGAAFAPALRAAERELKERLGAIAGALVEGKKFAVAAHYRQVGPADLARFRAAVAAVAARHPKLRLTTGKKVFEFLPDLDWDKGKALLWLLRTLGLDGADIVPLYIGDDRTDEDAFAALRNRDRGIAIVVGEGLRPTLAHYTLKDPGEVKAFLGTLIAMLEARRR